MMGPSTMVPCTQVVEAASALDDKDFLAVVRAVVERRPSLSVLLSVVDTAAASLEPNRVEDENEITDAEEVELPDTVVEVDEIIDVPVVLATDPKIPEPDYTEGGVPHFRPRSGEDRGALRYFHRFVRTGARESCRKVRRRAVGRAPEGRKGQARGDPAIHG